jgi:hypothetical protein
MEHAESQSMRNTEGERYGEYAEHVYQSVVKVMKEIGAGGKVKLHKILRYHQLPAEAVYAFKKLEQAGYQVNDIPAVHLERVLRYIYGLIDRNDPYDAALQEKIGKLETLRWRQGDELKEPDSFYKIVSTLREHAVPERPQAKDEQQPRVHFQPRGEYRGKQNLS